MYLKLRPYRQKSLAQRRNEKLAPRFYGPFEVLAKVGQVAYRLRLPASATIHPVFHVSQLRRAVGSTTPGAALPPQLAPNMELQARPSALRGVRQASRGTTAALEVLIHWENLPDHEDSWESFDRIKVAFLDFHLEDKVSLWAGGIDRPPGPPIRFTYARRKPRRLRFDRAGENELEADVEETVGEERGTNVKRALKSDELTTE